MIYVNSRNDMQTAIPSYWVLRNQYTCMSLKRPLIMTIGKLGMNMLFYHKTELDFAPNNVGLQSNTVTVRRGSQGSNSFWIIVCTFNWNNIFQKTVINFYVPFFLPETTIYTAVWWWLWLSEIHHNDWYNNKMIKIKLGDFRINFRSLKMAIIISDNFMPKSGQLKILGAFKSTSGL